MDLEKIQRVYGKLSDELSREIYLYRLMYSVSNGSEIWLSRLAQSNPDLKYFFKCLHSSEKDIVVMGAGLRGKQLVHLNKDIKWKELIDNNPKEESYENIPIMKTAHFLRDYNGELVVIASRVYETEMHRQLLVGGVPENSIISYGNILDRIMHEQYFDLPEILSDDAEVFVDVGCFDGMSSIELNKRIGDKLKRVIAFEADEERVEICKKNMREAHIDFDVIGKGCWSEECILHFNIAPSGLLTISEAGDDRLEVTSIDKALNGKKVTFIKMDIEGSELEALKGCRKTIEVFRPKLAICVYHRLEDIFEIPSLILEYCNEYKFYLRHYSPYWAETVLYAIPAENVNEI